MSILPRVLLAGACCLAAAPAVQAQTIGTYLPGALYTDPAPTVVAPPTNVLGGSGSLGGPIEVHPGSNGYNATDVARLFYQADGDHDGSLTELEARRLGISSQAFHELDRNNDGVLSRSEFEDALR